MPVMWLIGQRPIAANQLGYAKGGILIMDQFAPGV